MSIEDKELDEMFHGEEKPLHPDTVHTSLTANEQNRAVRKERSTAAEKTAQKSIHQPTHNFKDGKWEPIGEPPKPAPNGLDNLKACAKWVVLFGGLSFLLFYWKEAGLMAESIAVPSIATCTMLAGWGAGINARRGQ